MGFWHTGYLEFHETSGFREDEYRPAPPRFDCEHCGSHFGSLEELRRHRFERHPQRQPLLLIRGRAVGQLPLKLMTPLEPGDVAIEDVSRCKVNGRSVAPASLGGLLAGMKRKFVDLELANKGATTKCALDFQVADEAHLQGVEAAFLRMARGRELSLDAVARFIDECKPFDSAAEYSDGICQYLYGVMAKDRMADSGLRAEQYTEKLIQASDSLAGYHRSLANSIRALVAFHFNHFEDAELLAPEGTLRHAAGAFAGLLQGLPWHYEKAFDATSGDAIENLLTDQESLQILADASHGLIELKARTVELLAHLRRAPGDYDRLKRALLAAEALAARDDAESRAEARRLARNWVGQEATRVWAEAMLNRLELP